MLLHPEKIQIKDFQYKHTNILYDLFMDSAHLGYTVIEIKLLISIVKITCLSPKDYKHQT